MILRIVVLLLLVVGIAPSRAQDPSERDALMRQIYASLEAASRADFEQTMKHIGRGLPFDMMPRVGPPLTIFKLIAYNKAAIFASCAAETMGQRPPRARRVPSSENLLLRTCVETRIRDMRKSRSMTDYANTFFPDRTQPCGQRTRLVEREELLKPYAFLELEEPRLYDFAAYNRCLMSGASRFEPSGSP